MAYSVDEPIDVGQQVPNIEVEVREAALHLWLEPWPSLAAAWRGWREPCPPLNARDAHGARVSVLADDHQL